MSEVVKRKLQEQNLTLKNLLEIEGYIPQEVIEAYAFEIFFQTRSLKAMNEFARRHMKINQELVSLLDKKIKSISD